MRPVILPLLALLAIPCVSAAQPSARPNIVVFLTDDHSLRDSSVYGAKDVRTDRKSTRLNSSHVKRSRMPSSA